MVSPNLPYTAVLFDLDGTIVDSASGHHGLARVHLRAAGAAGSVAREDARVGRPADHGLVPRPRPARPRGVAARPRHLPRALPRQRQRLRPGLPGHRRRAARDRRRRHPALARDLEARGHGAGHARQPRHRRPLHRDHRFERRRDAQPEGGCRGRGAPAARGRRGGRLARRSWWAIADTTSRARPSTTCRRSSSTWGYGAPEEAAGAIAVVDTPAELLAALGLAEHAAA